MGGIAKGQIVREIDALGGYSGIVSDKSAIQFRMLNLSKGPAMWSPRTQNDRMLFSQEWRIALEKTPNLDFWQDTVASLIIDNNKVVGVISERDYITKVSAKRLNDNDVKVKDICTYSPIIIATKDDSLDSCMSKMLFKDIRHLLILDDKKDEFVGMISIKDLIKEIMKKNDDIITRLSDFKIGKGAFFGSE